MFIERPLRYKDKLFCSSYCRKCGIAYERDENVKPSKKLKIWVKDKKGIEYYFKWYRI